MATYVIGDIQGCYQPLRELLRQVAFEPARDRLWAVGDLVNRGPESLEVLRFFKHLGDSARVVLGNHDLHLLAVGLGDPKHLKPKDTLEPILRAPDRDDLLQWLRQQPLLHHDPELGYTMIHAGLPPQWDFATARACAAEAETVLRGERAGEFLAEHMYGDQPDRWHPDLGGWERIRFITNCLTRLRYCTPDGRLDMKKKYAPADYNDGDYPWFHHPERASRDTRIVFGHWSTLGYYAADGVYALDTGCLWGGSLTALRLDDPAVFRLDCPGERKPDKKSKKAK